MKARYFLIALFFAGQSLASNVVLVDGTNWGFQFDPTGAQIRKASSATGDFRFEAITRDGFIVSGFVESADGKGTSAETCKNHYWQLASRNPAIVQESVVAVPAAGPFEVVSYVVTGSEQGQSLVQINANYYGYRDGKCIDIHVSQAFPAGVDPDYANLLTFAESFGYANAQ